MASGGNRDCVTLAASGGTPWPAAPASFGATLGLGACGSGSGGAAAVAAAADADTCSFGFASTGSGGGGVAPDVTPLIQCAQPQRTPIWATAAPPRQSGSEPEGGAPESERAAAGQLPVGPGPGLVGAMEGVVEAQGPKGPQLTRSSGGGGDGGRGSRDAMEVDGGAPEPTAGSGPGAAGSGPGAALAPEPCAAPAAGLAPRGIDGGSQACRGRGGGGRADGADAKDDVLGLSACVVPHRAVGDLVWAVLRRVVPPALLGGKRNRAVLRRGLDALVRLRRHETVSLHHLLRGLRTSDMPWLSSAARGSSGAVSSSASTQGSTPAGGHGAPAAPAAAPTAQQPGNQLLAQRQHEQRRRRERERQAPPGAPAAAAAGSGGRAPRSLHEARRRWIAQWVWWLAAELVVPLLRNSFYVTESEPYRQHVFYYR
jgi:hypothetical protein